MSMQGLGRGLGQGLASLGQMMMQERAADKQRLADEEAWAKRFGMQQQAVNDRVQAERDYNNEMVPVYGGSVSPVVGPMMVPREEAAQTRQNLFRMFADSVAADRAAAARKFDPNNDPAIQRTIWERNNPTPVAEYDPRLDQNVQRELALEALGLGRYYAQPTAPEAAYDPEKDAVLLRERAKRDQGLGVYREKTTGAPTQAQQASRDKSIEDLFMATASGYPAGSALLGAGLGSEMRGPFYAAYSNGGYPAAVDTLDAILANGPLPDGYRLVPVYDEGAAGRAVPRMQNGQPVYEVVRDVETPVNRKFFPDTTEMVPTAQTDPTELLRLLLRGGDVQPNGVPATALPEDWMR